MRLDGAVGLVTGANRGIGRAFATALLEHGAAKVYAGVRDPASVTDPRLVPIRLDVTDPEQVAEAARRAGDVTVLINNAGVGAGTDGLLADSFDDARQAMEVNYWGTWSVSRAFAPVLAAGGGGALVNMLSVASWRPLAASPGYGPSKAAQWSLTSLLRTALAAQNTLVIGVHCGFVDTDLSAWVDQPKISADEVAGQTMVALLADQTEVLADEVTRQVRAELSRPAPEVSGVF